ncbi:SH3 domain-containing protein [Aestuariispira insulae]|uniref:Caspase domain-containing protein n=1 Tax=Aestuariispira insulae TaxID=1461337 RepID=A0A3D9HZ74_9PROT|nr:SH3 domain-containing protein [Aestuariispira insulae]RED54206.1 caspase domain-containing protein [Aestuariispira insulae]
MPHWFRIGLIFLAVTLPALAPARAQDDIGVAIIIGNKSYGADVPKVLYAHRDADAFRDYVVDVLKMEEENIIDLRDASQAEMLAVFGSERSHQGKLWSYLDPAGKSDVVIYYSGHGVPGIRDGRGYLLPVDADPNLAEINGYPLDLLYQNLGRLETASVTVFLDACFSGDSPNGVLIRAASPGLMQVALPEEAAKMTVLTAASGSQLASWDEEEEHGLFTGYLMEGLYGEADGNDDGEITAAEVKAYLDAEMTRAARRRFLRDQVASLTGDGTRVLSRPGEDGFPEEDEALDEEGYHVEIPASGYLYVGPEYLNLRAGPGTIYEKLAVLSPNTRLQVLSRAGDSDWLRVSLTGGQKGYVFGQFLRQEPPGRPETPRPIIEEVPEDEELFLPPPAAAARPPRPENFWRPIPGDLQQSQPIRRNPVQIGQVNRLDFKKGNVVIALNGDVRAQPLRPRGRLVTMTRDGRMIFLTIIKVNKKKLWARVAGDVNEMEVGLRVFARR